MSSKVRAVICANAVLRRKAGLLYLRNQELYDSMGTGGDFYG
jgi:hypothetical protein